MAKANRNDITSHLTEWEGYSGESVQKYIKEAVSNYSIFNAADAKIYYFATKEEMNTWAGLAEDAKQADDPETNLWTWRTEFKFDGKLESIVIATGDSFYISTYNYTTSAGNLSSCQLDASTRYIYLHIPKFVTRTSSVTGSASQDIEGDEYTIDLSYASGSGYTTIASDIPASGGKTINYRVSVNTQNGQIRSAASEIQFRLIVTRTSEDGSKLRSTYFLTSNKVSVFNCTFSMSNPNWTRPLLGSNPSGFTIQWNLGGTTTQYVWYRWYKETDAKGNPASSWDTAVDTNTWTYGGVTYDLWTSAGSIGLGAKNIPTLPQGGTGVYLLYLATSVKVGETHIYINSTTMRIMYVASGDNGSARLLTYNGTPARSFNNGEKTRAIYVAAYNQGSSSSVQVALKIASKIKSNGDASSSDVISYAATSVTPGVAKWLEYEPIYETSLENWTFGYSIQIEYGNADANQYTRAIYGSTTCSVKNNMAYNPIKEAAFVINPSAMSNQSNKTSIGSPATSVSTTNINFVEGEDGWDDDGLNELRTRERNDDGTYTYGEYFSRSCLRLPARSKMVINRQPMSATNITNNLTGFTIDMTFRTSCVSDYNADAFTIASGTDDDWFGIKIKGDRIMLRTLSENGSATDRDRDYTFMEDETINLIITYIKNYTKTGKNTCIVYVNGAKVREFQCGKDTSKLDDIVNSGYITIGSDKCDFYLYAFRYYYKALSTLDAMGNYVASHPLYYLKEEAYNKLYSVVPDGATSLGMDFNKCKANGNVFVITAPTLPNPKNDTTIKNCTVDLYYKSGTTLNWSGVDIKGQGSSSKYYWRWNFNMKMGDKVQWSPDSSSKIKSATAKKNFASGTQSHKMGFTMMYDKLHDAIVGPVGRHTAVHQYPFYGFLKTGNTYTFIGLYTLGPDKGDKYWFGYDKKDYLQVEGTDQSYPATAFRFPANVLVDTGAADNALEGTINAQGVKNWEYGTSKRSLLTQWGNAYDLVHKCGQMILLMSKSNSNVPKKTLQAYNPETSSNAISTADISEEEARLKAKYGDERENLSDTEKASWDQDMANFRKTFQPSQLAARDKVNRSVGNYEIIQRNSSQTDYGHQYYFDETVLDEKETMGSYVRVNNDDGSAYNALSVLDQTGLRSAFNNASTSKVSESKETMTEVLRRARRKIFKSQYKTYWNSDALFFEFCFKIINAISDNFKKNFYPFVFDGEKIDLRQDDLDSLGPVNNNGRNGKQYYSEFEDTYTESSTANDAVFSGTDSNLAQLLASGSEGESSESSFYAERKAMGRKILSTLVSIGQQMHHDEDPDTNLLPYDAIMKVYDTYLWKKAQEYFPASAYNADTEYSYEDASKQPSGSFKSDVNPLTQVTGPAYETERSWFMKRIIYCMSMYEFGDFEGVTDSLDFGSIKWRNQNSGGCNVKLKYALAMYPKCMTGQGDGLVPIEHKRVKAGEEVSYHISVGATTYATILGGDYIQSFESDDLTNDAEFKISSKRLENVRIGGSSNFSSLNCSGCTSLEKFDIHGVTSVTSVNLTGCNRLADVNISGTGIAVLTLPSGSKVNKLSLPSGITTIDYTNLRNLSNFSIQGYSRIAIFKVNNCSGIKSMFHLTKFYTKSGLSLGVHNINETYEGTDAAAIKSMLEALEPTGKTCFLADGVTTTTGYGFLSGTLVLKGVDVTAINAKFPKLTITNS